MPDTGTNTKPTNKERIKEIVAGIEDGIQKLFQSDKYIDYLRTMSRFHSYSVNNTILIHQQMPHASVVAGFNQWKNRFGRNVKKGEKGLTIIAPTPFKKKVEEMKLDPDTNAPMYDEDGKPIMEERFIEIPMFKPVKVFDLSQTEGKPLPQLAADLAGDVRQYEAFMEALRRTSPVPITMEKMGADMDGYFSRDEQRIAVREGMSQVATVCATVHEMGHALLHNREQAALTAAAGTDKEAPKPKDRATEEVEAESVSYAVCQYYGIETGSNSFGYIATWSKDKTLPELRASLETITKTANALITGIDKHFAEVCKERGIVLTERQEQTPAEETPAPESDTPQKFAEDFCAYLEQLYQEGVITNPFTTRTAAEFVPDMAELFQRGDFDNARHILDQAWEHTGADAAASLLERLEKLRGAWEAALVYEADENILATGDQDRGCIKVFAPTDPQHANGRIVFIGPVEQCRELTQKLNGRAITVKEVEAIEQRQIAEADRAGETPPAPERTETEALFLLDGERYLHIQTTDEGYDYTFYDAKTLRLLDGGQFPEISTLCHAVSDPMEAAYREVCVREGIDPAQKEPVSLDMLDTITKANAIPETAHEADRAAHAELIEYFLKEDAPLWDTVLDEYPVPDESAWEDTLEDVGYMEDDLLPLAKEGAEKLLEQDMTVYILRPGEAPEMAFDREELQGQPVGTMFAVPRDEWEDSPEFQDAVNSRMDRQEEREGAFLNHSGDCFAIYQLKHDDDLRDIRYEPLETLRKAGESPMKGNYELVYTAPLPEGATLDTLFEKFNIDHPADYRHPSVSVSDILAIKQDGVVACHYVDRYAFIHLPGFFEKENYLKNAELAMEDDANMIDGIINNGPKQPTVAELEASVKAGGQISLLDLANAVKAEHGNKPVVKRKSVLARLNAPLPKQQEKQKSAPKKSAERDR